jgi:gentisate 1,2-dioxygenase
MNDLGKLEDLPADYRAELTRHNLVPLWPSLRGVMPPHVPGPKTQPTHWSYQCIKPLLMQAGELTPIEKAERRVLVLANPGHGLDKMQAIHEEFSQRMAQALARHSEATKIFYAALTEAQQKTFDQVTLRHLMGRSHAR